MSKTFRIEIIIPFVVDELEDEKAAKAYGEFLASDLLDRFMEFEIRATEERSRIAPLRGEASLERMIT